MFSFGSDTPDINCPECHTLMVEMSGFETALRDGVGVGTDTRLLGFGMRRFALNPFGFAELIGNLVDSVLDVGKGAKAKKLCRETLPSFPKSQICPKCLYVFRRK